MNGRALLRALPLFLAVAVACAALLTVWAWPERAWENDTASYVAVAQSILSGEGVSTEGQPEFFRTPGYPLLLAAGVLSGSFWTVSFLQYLLAALTLLLCARTARMLNPKIGEIPALKWWLLLLAPHFLVYPALLLTETLFGFLLAASVWFGVRWRATRARRDLLAAALLLGLLPLVRPVGVVAVGLYGAFLVVRYVKHARRHFLPRPRRIAGALLLALIAAGPTLGWSARNAAEGGPFAVSTVSSHNLHHYNAVRIQSVRERRAISDVRFERAALERQWKEENPEATPGDLARWQNREGLRTMLESPFLTAAVTLYDDLASFLPEAAQICELFGLTTGGRGTLAVLQQEGPLAAAKFYFGDETSAWPFVLWGCLWAALFVLALGQSLLVSLCRPVPWLWFLALLGFAQLLVVGAPANPRFLFPSLPLFFTLILAANDDVAPRRKAER